MKTPKLSASIMCADLLNLGRDITILQKGNIDSLHFDIMDSHFVPSIGFGISLLEQITRTFNIQLDVHLMVTNPESLIDPVIDAGGSLVTLHAEIGDKIEDCINKIKNKGGKAGIALRPETPVTSIAHLLDRIHLVLLMAYPPGTHNQPPIDTFEHKVKQTTAFLEDHSNTSIDIAIDGSVSEQSVKKYKDLGANFFILGSSGLFIKGVPLKNQLKKMQAIVAG